ncbi:hypothetical protein U3516DRAFT_889912 [Neocallimastix sp. 'constans']
MVIIVVLLLLAPIPTKVTIIDVLIRVFHTIITSPYSHDLCSVTCFGILLLLPNIPLVRINTACLC